METKDITSTANAGFLPFPVVTTTAVGSLNLAGEARIHVTLLHSTGTDPAFTLKSLTVEPLS